MGLFDDLGISFSKSPEEKKIKEAKKHIAELEEKRDVLLKALDKEITDFKDDNDEVFRKMGSYIYGKIDEMREKGLVNPQFETFITLVKENESKIQESEEKKVSIVSRYDEELEILQKTIKAEEEKIEINKKIEENKNK